MPDSFGIQLNVSAIHEVGIPQLRSVWNEFDEHGLTVNLYRIQGETNWEYKRRILDVFVNIANSSYRGLVNGITRELGLTLIQPMRINPRRSLVSGAFWAADPYIKIDGAYIYLYSDYANGTLDYKIDRYEPGGNYEHLTRLVTFINQTTYFEATIETGFDAYMSSMVLLNQSNRIEVPQEEVPVSTRFRLANPYVINSSFYFTDYETFAKEMSTEAAVTSKGKYWIDYQRGIIRTFNPPSKGESVSYQYISYPFLPVASPVILHDINSEAFRAKMFEQVLLNDGSYSHGLPTEIGVDIINELLSVTPMYWGE